MGAPERGVFGSALSTSGYALAAAGGLVPLAAVTGCHLRSVSIRLPLPVYRQPPHVARPVPDEIYADDVLDVDELDRAETEARHRAYAQLRGEAERVGADAVIDLRRIAGARLATQRRFDLGRAAAVAQPGPHPYLARTVEHQLIGTAVRDAAHRSARPQLSAMSAADFWRLQSQGWRPVDVVGGCAHRLGASLWVASAGHEIQGSTAVWTAAREGALAQLRRELADVTADGVIDIRMDASHQIVEWTERVALEGVTGRTRRAPVGRQGILVSVSVLGTAVRRVARATDAPLSVTSTVDLS